MDFSTELRRTYLGAAPHTLYTAGVWLASGLVGEYASKSTGIMFFIIAASLTFPGGEVVRKLMRAPNLISEENKLGKLFMLSAFGIPLCYPIIYLVCKGNINYFFPAFSILIGAHYLIFIYGYGMNTFGLIAGLLVVQGTLTALYLPNQFGLSAYLTAAILFVFGIYHYIKVKQESHE
jgi:hypothetical protein